MKDREVIVIGRTRFIRIGTHKDSVPYINIDSIYGSAFPENKDLRKLRRMINYVLNDKRCLKKKERKK